MFYINRYAKIENFNVTAEINKPLLLVDLLLFVLLVSDVITILSGSRVACLDPDLIISDLGGESCELSDLRLAAAANMKSEDIARQKNHNKPKNKQKISEAAVEAAAESNSEAPGAIVGVGDTECNDKINDDDEDEEQLSIEGFENHAELILTELLKPLNGLMGFSMNSNSKYFKGTIFRLPLRMGERQIIKKSNNTIKMF